MTPVPWALPCIHKACDWRLGSEGGAGQRRGRERADTSMCREGRHQVYDCPPDPEGLATHEVSATRPVSCTKQIPRSLLGRMELATRGPTQRAGQRSRFLRLPLAPPPRRCPRFTADTESHCISTASIRAGGGHPSRSCGGHGIACELKLKMKMNLPKLIQKTRSARNQAKQARSVRTIFKRRGFVIKPRRFKTP